MADVVPGKKEFDTPDINTLDIYIHFYPAILLNLFLNSNNQLLD